MSGSSTTSPTETKCQTFSISAVDEGLSGFTYLWEQTQKITKWNLVMPEVYLTKIANRTENLSWSFDGNLGVTIGGADYAIWVKWHQVSPIQTEQSRGTFNQSGSLKFCEDGQSDGFNDHATRYNTNVSKSIEVVDTYGGVPSCLLFGSMVSKSDGSVVNVEDLNIGDSILSVSLQGSTDESVGDWKNDVFNQSGSFTQHSASVQRVLYEFSQHYYNINSGQEYNYG